MALYKSRANFKGKLFNPLANYNNPPSRKFPNPLKITAPPDNLPHTPTTSDGVSGIWGPWQACVPLRRRLRQEADFSVTPYAGGTVRCRRRLGIMAHVSTGLRQGGRLTHYYQLIRLITNNYRLILHASFVEKEAVFVAEGVITVVFLLVHDILPPNLA